MGFFKIQDGRQDGRRITKNAITSLIIDLELRIWCLLVCFGWQGIHLCGLSIHLKLMKSQKYISNDINNNKQRLKILLINY